MLNKIIFSIRIRISLLKSLFVTYFKRRSLLNSASFLNIKTYDGGNQGLHPSCLYFKDGWCGYKFWFVFTPYKGMNDAIENPCMYVSNDGEHFTSIEGANPLDDIALTKEQEYNSDPELVYNSDLDRIECWWRRVQTNEYPTEEGKNREIIYRSYTTDGKSWSDKQVMLDYKNDYNDTTGVISPSLIYENGTYKMWAINSESDEREDNRYVDYYEMKDGQQAKLVSHTKVIGSTLSHIDVIRDKDDYKLIGFDVAIVGFPYKLFSFSSPQGPYKYEGFVLARGKRKSWDGGRLYRPSVVIVDGEYWLYYSAYEHYNSTHNHVGLIRFKSWKDLKKCFIQRY